MAKVTSLTRIFEHNGTEIPDPNPSASIREVQDMLSAQYPELANAKPRIEENGSRTTVTFTVAAGTKG
jgi:PRTRC genetic system protein C